MRPPSSEVRETAATDEGFEARYQAYTDVVHGQPQSLTHLQLRLLSDIKLPVQVEIGSLMLSAEDVIDLTADQILDFSFDPAEPVVLRVGSEIAALGRLVISEDRLVIQILSTEVESGSSPAATNREKPPTTELREKSSINEEYYSYINTEQKEYGHDR